MADLLHNLRVENTVLRAALKLKRLPDDMSRYESMERYREEVQNYDKDELIDLYCSAIETLTSALLERDDAIMKNAAKEDKDSWVELEESDIREIR